MKVSKIIKKLLQEASEQPLQLTYDKYYGGNARTKRRRKIAEENIKETLRLFKDWRKLKEFEDKRAEKIKEYYQPEKEKPPNKKQKGYYLVYRINQFGIQKLGRLHYLNNLIFSIVCSLIYLIIADFNLFENLFFFLLFSAMLTASTIYYVTNTCYSIRVTTHIDNIDISKYVILRMGEPGAGKSSSACHDSYAMAEKVYKKLCFKYWLIKNKISKIYSGTHIEHKVLGIQNGQLVIHYERVYTGNKDKIERTIEIIEAYEYYKDHPEVIPCLYSSIPVQDEQGRNSLQFTANHLLQKENLLSYGVAFLDEIGSMLPPQLSNQKIETIDLSFRFIRQFHDFHIISTEQDGKAVVISARRVTAENKRMLKQKHILKPMFLNWLCNKLEDRVVEKDIKPTQIKVGLLTALRKYVNSVGFRRFSYIDNGNLQFQGEGNPDNCLGKTKVQTFVTPPNLNCFYDDRTFKNLNKAKNQASNPIKWNGLVLSEKELNNLFNREILSKAYK